MKKLIILVLVLFLTSCVAQHHTHYSKKVNLKPNKYVFGPCPRK
jgi:hypothetical protein